MEVATLIVSVGCRVAAAAVVVGVAAVVAATAGCCRHLFKLPVIFSCSFFPAPVFLT